MTRIAIAVLAVGFLGAAVGAVAVHLRLGPELVDAVQSEGQLAAERDRLARELTMLREKVDRVEDENRLLALDLASFFSEMEGMRAFRTELELMHDLDEETMGATLADGPDGRWGRPFWMQDEDGDEDGDGEERRRGDRRNWMNSVEAEERFRNMRNRARETFDSIIADEFEKHEDPATRQRLAALADQWAYRDELRDAMRGAESDEQRQALAEEMRAVSQTTRSLVREQQDTLLRNLAASHGIADPATQQAFVRATRETLRNPFFESQQFLGASSRGGGGGRGGGGPGRPGGPPTGQGPGASAPR